jgi:hypothetical protein
VVWSSQPQTKRGGDRRSAAAKDQSANLAHRSAFIDDTAAKTGQSRRAVARDVARAEALGPDLDRVAGPSLDKGAKLHALPAMQRDG